MHIILDYLKINTSHLVRISTLIILHINLTQVARNSSESYIMHVIEVLTGLLLLHNPFAHSAFQRLIPILIQLHVILVLNQVHIALTIKQP